MIRGSCLAGLFNSPLNIYFNVVESESRPRAKLPNQMSSQSDDKSSLRTATCEIMAMYPQNVVLHKFWSAGGVDGVTKCTVKKSKQSILTRGVAGLLTRGGGNNHFRTLHA